MKIKKTIQKAEVIEIDIETPCWYKVTGYEVVTKYQINSEADIIEVKLDNEYTTIRRMPYGYFYQAEKIFVGEIITEDEFNEAFSEAMDKITASYLSPLPILETA